MLAPAVSLDAFFYLNVIARLVFRVFHRHDIIMINVSNLCFEYAGKQVLHDVSFSIKENSVVALVGPNGAGKTTLMRCLAALHLPMSGQVIINGIDTQENPRQVHRMTGYLSDFFGLYDKLTVRQCLQHMAGCQNMSKVASKQRIEEVVFDTGLDGYVEQKAGTLSRGYRQRLGVAMAVIHQPKFLILDEPASGMDPEARVELSHLIERLKAKGMTIMVSSHILAELEDYCSEMLVIRNGRVRDYVSKERSVQNAKLVRVSCLNADDLSLDFADEYGHILNASKRDGGFEFSYTGDKKMLHDILASLLSKGVEVYDFTVAQESLQKAYMDIAYDDAAHAGGKV